MMPKLRETAGIPAEAKMVHEIYQLGTAYWLVCERNGDALTGEGWGFACVGDPDNGEWIPFKMCEIKNIGARLLHRPPMSFPSALGIARAGAEEFARIRNQMSDALTGWC